MRQHPLYTAFATLLFGFAALATWQGWSLTSVDEVKNVPRSVRDNPGAYRTIYRSHPRYFGGK